MTPVTRILVIIDRFRRREDGQGLAEYALILALIAIVAIVALLFLGSQISDKLSIVGSTLESVDDRRPRTHVIPRPVGPPSGGPFSLPAHHPWTGARGRRPTLQSSLHRA